MLLAITCLIFMPFVVHIFFLWLLISILFTFFTNKKYKVESLFLAKEVFTYLDLVFWCTQHDYCGILSLIKNYFFRIFSKKLIFFFLRKLYDVFLPKTKRSLLFMTLYKHTSSTNFYYFYYLLCNLN